MREGEREGRLSEAWMTACDATLVIVQEDRGVYTASLALSPLMAVCVLEEVRAHCLWCIPPMLPVFRQRLQQC